MIVGVLASAGAVEAADNSHYLKVNVPFAFTVAGEPFGAGQYQITEDQNGIVTLQGAGKGAAVISTPLETSKPKETTGLRFANSASRDLIGIALEGEGSRAIAESKVAMASR